MEIQYICIVSNDLFLFMFENESSTRGPNSMPSLFFRRDHLRPNAAPFGDHLRRCRVQLIFYHVPQGASRHESSMSCMGQIIIFFLDDGIECFIFKIKAANTFSTLSSESNMF